VRQIMDLFRCMFCVVRAVHAVDFGLVMNGIPNKWRPVERRSCSDSD
jgi:hypothetical protein